MAISAISAFIFALGGVGAAIILFPILISLGIPVETARPVGLFFNTISLLGATAHNIKNKKLDVKTGIPIIAFSFLFAIFGAYISRFITSRLILLLFIMFLLFSSTMFLFHRVNSEDMYRNDNNTPYVKLSLIGAIAGTLSGMLGVGGGGIISPLMLSLKYHPKKIATITAFVVPFSSFSGFLTYWAMGNVDWSILIAASSGGVIGAVLGTKFMHSKLDHKAVKKILGGILMLMAIKLIYKVI